MKAVTLSQEGLQKTLEYFPETGEFIWKRSGKIAGNLGQNGYRYIRVYYHLYLASRLAFLYMTGKWPTLEMDHKDGNSLNDAWSNLREASPLENKRNRRQRTKTHSGFKGVFLDKRNTLRPWYARITVDDELVFLGGFSDPTKAAEAYDKAALEYFGVFASTNFGGR